MNVMTDIVLEHPFPFTQPAGLEDDANIFAEFENEYAEELSPKAPPPELHAPTDQPLDKVPLSAPAFLDELDSHFDHHNPPSPSHSVASSLGTSPLERLGSAATIRSVLSPRPPPSPLQGMDDLGDLPNAVGIDVVYEPEEAQEKGQGAPHHQAHQQQQQQPHYNQAQNNNEEDDEDDEEDKEGEGDANQDGDNRADAANAVPFNHALPANMAVRVCPAPETLWYARRTHPAFEVHLVDRESGQIVHNVSGLKVELTLVDANGNDMTPTISQNNAYPTLTHGCTVITGLRYTSVTSKCGGHFKLVVSIPLPPSHTGATIANYVSDEIQVLSYRLYRSPKVALDQLSPDDPVKHMKGIGAMYAKRLEGLGIKSVGQLAELDVNELGRDRCRKLISSLRKDRGALTLERFKQYIAQAQEVVSRYRD